MKMYGSNQYDTLMGTKGVDRIETYGGFDLIATGGGADVILAGADNDMITGFSFNLQSLARSASRGANVDGGAGDQDILIAEMIGGKRATHVDSILDVMKVKNVEEFIYNFATVKARQQLFGTEKSETITVGEGDAKVDMAGGNDYVYTLAGDDIVKGGKGSDFIHAGEGHNTVSGGTGVDYFHFHITDGYQYTEITDFEAGQDKIVVTIDTAQVNLLFGHFDDQWENLEGPLPVRAYGDGYLGVGPQINAYVSYNHGREFDADDFSTTEEVLPVDFWSNYEQDTGSIFVYHYEEHSWGLELEKVLVGHVKPGTAIEESDFSFRML